MKLDRRTSFYRLQKKVIRQWLSVLVVTIALVYISQPVQKPVSPCPDAGCRVEYIKKVKAAEPIKQPQTIEEKIRAAFPEDPDMAVDIARCESGLRANAFNPHNKNGSWDAGLFQINSVHKYTKDHLMNVDNNLKAARKLYDRQGWSPWVCYRKIK